jgi:hypothetical protein
MKAQSFRESASAFAAKEWGALVASAAGLGVIAALWTYYDQDATGPNAVTVSPPLAAAAQTPEQRANARLREGPSAPIQFEYRFAKHMAAGSLEASAEKPATASPPPASAPAQQIPPLPYRYVGQLISEKEHVLLLARQQKVLMAHVGDIVEGAYRVEEIRPQSVRLTYLPLGLTQIVLAPGVSAAGDRPIDFLLTAPAQVARGSTFQVSLDLPPGTPVQSAKFRVNFDPNSLEALDITDATGTSLLVSTSGAGNVELDIDQAYGAMQAPAVRFLAKGTAPFAAQITVTAEQVLDGAGKTLATIPLAPRSVMVVP